MLDFTLIDYHNCITNLTSSIQKHYGINPNYSTMKIADEALNEKDYQNVILMVFDAMGSSILDKNTTENHYLRKRKVADFYSTFPPTTANCTTAYQSGKNPIETGWLGWATYFKQIDKTVDNFTNDDSFLKEKIEGENIANHFIPYKTLGSEIEENTKDVHYYSFMPSFAQNGCISLKQMENRLVNLCNQPGKKYIYVYWDEPDHIMHQIGTQNNVVKKILNDISKFLQNVERKTKDSIAFVSADHGQIDVKEIAFYTYFDIYATLKCTPSCDARSAMFFIKDGMNKTFETLFHTYFSKYYTLLSKNEMIEKHLFGEGKEHPLFQEILGDYIAIAHSDYYFSFTPNRKMTMRGHHAGLLKDEMQIPLILIKN